MTLAKHLRLLTARYTSNPNILYLRDGEVVLYRRSISPLYQCRLKLANGSSTESANADGGRYLQFSVNGKTGKRTLIARHNTQDFLEGLRLCNEALCKLSFDVLVKKYVDNHVFKLSDGTTGAHLNGTYRNLM